MLPIKLCVHAGFVYIYHFKTALFSRPTFLHLDYGIVEPGLRKLAFINSGHSVHTSEMSRKLDEHLTSTLKEEVNYPVLPIPVLFYLDTLISKV